MFVMLMTMFHIYIAEDTSDRILIINATTFKKEDEISTTGATINHLALSHNGEFLLWGNEAFEGKCFNLNTMETVTLQGHTSGVLCIVAGDGTDVITCARDNDIRVWDGLTGSCKKTMSGHTGWVCSVIYHMETKRIFSGSLDQKIICWDYESGAWLDFTCVSSRYIMQLTWANESFFSCFSLNGTTDIYNARDLTLVGSLLKDAKWSRVFPQTLEGKLLIDGFKSIDDTFLNIVSAETMSRGFKHLIKHAELLNISPSGHSMSCFSVEESGRLIYYTVNPPFAHYITSCYDWSLAGNKRSMNLFSDGTLCMSGEKDIILNLNSKCVSVDNTHFKIDDRVELAVSHPYFKDQFVEAINAVINNLNVDPEHREITLERMVKRHKYDLLQVIRSRTGPFKQRVSRNVMLMIGNYVMREK